MDEEDILSSRKSSGWPKIPRARRPQAANMAAQPSPTSSNENVQTIAVLPLSGTTVTATVPRSTSGVAVVDGTTISFRQEGITLSNGQVFSLGFDGLVASTTTASYEYVRLSLSQSVRYDSTRHPSGMTVVLTYSGDMGSTLPPDTPLLPTTSMVMSDSRCEICVEGYPADQQRFRRSPQE